MFKLKKISTQNNTQRIFFDYIIKIGQACFSHTSKEACSYQQCFALTLHTGQSAPSKGADTYILNAQTTGRGAGSWGDQHLHQHTNHAQGRRILRRPTPISSTHKPWAGLQYHIQECVLSSVKWHNNTILVKTGNICQCRTDTVTNRRLQRQQNAQEQGLDMQLNSTWDTTIPHWSFWIGSLWWLVLGFLPWSLAYVGGLIEFLAPRKKKKITYFLCWCGHLGMNCRWEILVSLSAFQKKAK